MIIDLAVHHLWYDGMTDGQHGQELRDDGRARVAIVQILI